MPFFMSRTTERSLDDFDTQLSNYFNSSKRYRSALRRGTIVLVDEDDSLSRFFQFLISRCGLMVKVLHFTSKSDARLAMWDIGIENVKAVLINAITLNKPEGKDSLSGWLLREHPRVPVWVFNCGPDSRQIIKRIHPEMGIIPLNEPLEELASTVGLPEECRQMALEYSA